MTPPNDTLYGLLAEFDGEETLIAATRRTREAGYRKMDAFSPFPIDDLAEALDFQGTGISRIVFTGGLVGGTLGFGLQYWVNVIAYPLNIGGKPFNSWPAFIPVTFETTILGAALAGVIGMFILNGLPMPYHPLFNVPDFSEVTKDGFFLCIEATDPQFKLDETRHFLLSLEPRKVFDVPE